jgi:Ca2+-binding RTX toxin-like protein
MGAGNDAVIDRSLSDSIVFGGAGADVFQTYAGNDMFFGGKGADSFYIDNSGDARHVDIWGGKGHDSVLVESDSAFMSKTVLDNGEIDIACVNGTVITLHNVEDVHMITHSDIPPWV